MVAVDKEEAYNVVWTRQPSIYESPFLSDVIKADARTNGDLR